MTRPNQRLFGVYGSPYQTMGVNVPEYPPGTHPVRYEWIEGFRVEQLPDLRRVGGINGHDVVAINNANYAVAQRHTGTAMIDNELLNQADFIMPNIYRHGINTEPSNQARELIQVAMGSVPDSIVIPMELRRTVLGQSLSRMLPTYYDQFLWLYPQENLPTQE